MGLAGLVSRDLFPVAHVVTTRNIEFKPPIAISIPVLPY